MIVTFIWGACPYCESPWLLTRLFRNLSSAEVFSAEGGILAAIVTLFPLCPFACRPELNWQCGAGQIVKIYYNPD
ncbi:hypothetical protein [Microbulbifer taiwanensis]|uniref:hypothetical protein n=1 Tax=Microbulbifer taiwanensis TaxID=986746 RepID=UPI00361BDD2E